MFFACSFKANIMYPPPFLLLIITLFHFIFITNTFANNINPFAGKWERDYGVVNISNCQGMHCHISISTANGAHTCEVEEKLTVLSRNKAIFYIQSYQNPKKRSPVRLSLVHQIITVKIPDEYAFDATRSSCGLSGYFEGEYTNINTPRIYTTSFNCYKAKTKIEYALCRTPDLAKADSVLAKLYAQLKNKKNLLAEQRKWLKNRDILCNSATNLEQCLETSYVNRILDLEQQVINTNPRSQIYNYDYLLYVAKQPANNCFDVFLDPPLQHYLKTYLPKKITEEIMDTHFLNGNMAYQNDSIIIRGGAPGLYTIYEAAVEITNQHQTWFAYINIDNNSQTQIIVFTPKRALNTTMPPLLKKWVDHLLPHMDFKEVLYEPLFP